MDMQQNIKDHFAENLKAEEYFTEMHEFWKLSPEMFRFMVVNINEVFRSERFKGSKLLEIGSGATVHSIASASAYFSSIVMSDYVEDNVQQLKRWLRGESNLKQFLDIQAGLEGYGDDLEAGKKLLEARIRKAVKQVNRCDVLFDGILLDKAISAETSPPFDMIISCLCLEVAPEDLEGYFGIYKRINPLLRPGGGLLVCGFIQGGYWKILDKKFHHLQTSEEDLRKALTQAGFGNIDLKIKSKEDMNYIGFEYDKLFCVTAEKL